MTEEVDSLVVSSSYFSAYRYNFRFNIYRSTSPEGPFTLIAEAVQLPAGQFVDEDVEFGVTYHYQVSAVQPCGESNPVGSGSGSGTPQCFPASWSLTVTVTAGDGYLLIASPSFDGSKSFRLYRSSAAGGPYEVLADGHGPFEDSDVIAGDTYYYVVAELRHCGERASAEVSGVLPITELVPLIVPHLPVVVDPYTANYTGTKGIVSASSELPIFNTRAYAAVDTFVSSWQHDGPRPIGGPAEVPTQQWLQYQFFAPTLATHYNCALHGPAGRQCILQASNDGENWIDLVNFSSPHGGFPINDNPLPIPAPGSYLFYRLYFPGSPLDVLELQLFGPASA
ncbi:MAG TPA: hypothetical protein VEH04_16810 [Verrucomicrobiae bacterium]|nr:hypothetical protein [Verrucomicrobiae bacterium]